MSKFKAVLLALVAISSVISTPTIVKAEQTIIAEHQLTLDLDAFTQPNPDSFQLKGIQTIGFDSARVTFTANCKNNDYQIEALNIFGTGTGNRTGWLIPPTNSVAKAVMNKFCLTIGKGIGSDFLNDPLVKGQAIPADPKGYPDWVKVSEDNIRLDYIDPASVKKVLNVVSAVGFSRNQQTGDTHKFAIRVDCDRKKAATGIITSTNRLTPTGQWLGMGDLEPGLPSYWLAKNYCN